MEFRDHPNSELCQSWQTCQFVCLPFNLLEGDLERPGGICGILTAVYLTYKIKQGLAGFSKVKSPSPADG